MNTDHDKPRSEEGDALPESLQKLHGAQAADPPEDDYRRRAPQLGPAQRAGGIEPVAIGRQLGGSKSRVAVRIGHDPPRFAQTPPAFLLLAKVSEQGVWNNRGGGSAGRRVPRRGEEKRAGSNDRI